MGKYINSCTIWAVRFDNVLHDGTFPDIGIANEEMLRFFIERQRSGDKIILMAQNIDLYSEDVIKWSNEHNLFYDAVNKNIPELAHISFTICADAFVNETINQTAVKSMGFTDKLIRELLPAPELVNNPHHISGAKMKLWKLSDVEAAMRSPAFQDALDKKEKRRKSAEKGVATKRANLEADTVRFLGCIHIQRIDMNQLRERTLQAKRRWCELHDDYSDIYANDEAAVMRWMVNYVRHEMTLYDDQLYQMKGKTGIHEMHDKMHDLILDKIAETYPELADECMSQKIGRKEVC